MVDLIHFFLIFFLLGTHPSAQFEIEMSFLEIEIFIESDDASKKRFIWKELYKKKFLTELMNIFGKMITLEQFSILKLTAFILFPSSKS